MLRKEIEKRVYEKYPKTEKERTCAIEKRRITELRELYRKRIYDTEREKRIYSEIQPENKAL